MATAQRFLDCGRSMGGDLCGMYLSATVGRNAGSLAATRVAILTSSDVSGNDFLTRFLTYRTGPTRIFGPGPTAGGYGNIAYVPSHLFEALGGTFQMTDAGYRVGDLTVPPVLESLTGVPPDERVLQKQSDLCAGRDTLVETAKAWLRQ